MEFIEAESKEKQRIFDIALALMESVGYEKLSVRQICDEADISIGKFYRCFNSKQQLLNFVFSRFVHLFHVQISSELEDMEIWDQIITVYVRYTAYITGFGIDFVKNFYNSNNPMLDTHIYNNEIIVITDGLIARAIQKGLRVRTDRSIREISQDFCVIVKGIIFEWCIRRGEFNIAEYTERLLRTTAKSILSLEK